jgi:cellulose synthase/poly-beta-1,6-N-acetylglucosamine synthase-like glycosyltransferase
MKDCAVYGLDQMGFTRPIVIFVSEGEDALNHLSILEYVWLVFIVCFSLVWFLGRPLAVLISGLKKRPAGDPLRVVEEITGISIIVPCHNEEKLIEKTVASLMSQNLHGKSY